MNIAVRDVKAITLSKGRVRGRSERKLVAEIESPFEGGARILRPLTDFKVAGTQGKGFLEEDPPVVSQAEPLKCLYADEDDACLHAKAYSGRSQHPGRVRHYLWRMQYGNVHTYPGHTSWKRSRRTQYK